MSAVTTNWTKVMRSPLITLSPGRLEGSRSDLPLPGSHLMTQQSGTESEDNDENDVIEYSLDN